jgi:hypothetical protein
MRPFLLCFNHRREYVAHLKNLNVNIAIAYLLLLIFFFKKLKLKYIDRYLSSLNFFKKEQGFVISEMNGDTGDMLFQYATGYALSLRNQVEFRLDCRQLNHPNKRPLPLHAFSITSIPSHPLELKPLLEAEDTSVAKIKRKIFKKRSLVITETSPRFQPEIISLKAPVLLRGKFQNEKYFSDFRNEIAFEFQMWQPPSPENLAILENIRSCNSTGVYICRRKDQPSDSLTDLEYYKNAITQIENQTQASTYFFFSDDIAWANANFGHLASAIFIDINSHSEPEQLRLLSACQNQIIFNQPIGWWAAWLNPNPKKIVIKF